MKVYEMNRAMRRRMKKDLKLARTPTRQEAAALIMAGYKDDESPIKLVNEEPAKIRIPRAFETSDEKEEERMEIARKAVDQMIADGNENAAKYGGGVIFDDRDV